jgi:hypothetical protein
MAERWIACRAKTAGSLVGPNFNWNQCVYQSECGDRRLHDRHCVEVHWWRQAGQTPPVSNVFHSFPQEQDHRSSLRGDQLHSGHRIRGSEGSRLFSSSSSRSRTTDDLATSFKTVEISV